MSLRKRDSSNEEGKASGRKRSSSFVKIFVAAASFVFLGLVLVQTLSKQPNRSDPALRISSSSVSVYAQGGDLYFIPQGRETASTGFIMYPGAKVPKEAYSYLTRSVAEAGYPAVLIDVPLGYAIFNPNAASRPVAALPNVKRWVLAGHSLGGVAAALYAKKHQNIVAGIVFLGSYPPGGGSLASTKIQALSVAGQNDMLATKEKIEKAAPLLPESTKYISIPGGNHAQFGDYGPQRGDGAAEIPSGDQQRLVVDSVLAFLASLQ